MKTRIITGICVAFFWFFLLLWAPGWCLFPVLLIVMAKCQHEFYRMMERAQIEVSRKFGIIAGALWLTACYALPRGVVLSRAHADFPVFTALLTLGLFLLFVRVLLDPKVQRPLQMLGTTALGFLYIPFMFGFFINLAQWGAFEPFQIVSTREGIMLAAYVALVTKAGDIGAYATGMAIGKHKMFPRISPKKSWEGLAGGLALSMIISVAFVWLAENVFSPAERFATLRNFSLVEAAIVGLVLCAIGVLGDLVESQLKRATETKDSGAIFPGMGGLLDVFDSLTFTPAALYFYLLWMYPHG